MVKTIVFISGSLMICMTSCSPVLYSTVGQNVPLFREKGEVSLSAGFADAEQGEGVYVHAATAVSDHWAVLSSFYAMSGGAESDDNWRGDGSYFEFGGGRFDAFGAKENFTFEIFAGAGFGKIENSRMDSRANVKFFKPFIQPSIGLTGKWFDVAFTPRIAMISYSEHDYYSPEPEDMAAAERYFNEKENSLVLEPGITIRSGYKGIKLQVQYNTTTFSYTDEASDNEPNIGKNYFSVGVNYLFSKRFKNQ